MAKPIAAHIWTQKRPEGVVIGIRWARFPTELRGLGPLFTSEDGKFILRSNLVPSVVKTDEGTYVVDAPGSTTRYDAGTVNSPAMPEDEATQFIASFENAVQELNTKIDAGEFGFMGGAENYRLVE